MCAALYCEGTFTLISKVHVELGPSFLPPLISPSPSVRRIQSDSCSVASVPSPDPVGLPLDLLGEAQSAGELRAAQICTV